MAGEKEWLQEHCSLSLACLLKKKKNVPPHARVSRSPPLPPDSGSLKIRPHLNYSRCWSGVSGRARREKKRHGSPQLKKVGVCDRRREKRVGRQREAKDFFLLLRFSHQVFFLFFFVFTKVAAAVLGGVDGGQIQGTEESDRTVARRKRAVVSSCRSRPPLAEGRLSRRRPRGEQRKEEEEEEEQLRRQQPLRGRVRLRRGRRRHPPCS